MLELSIIKAGTYFVLAMDKVHTIWFKIHSFYTDYVSHVPICIHFMVKVVIYIAEQLIKLTYRLSVNSPNRVKSFGT